MTIARKHPVANWLYLPPNEQRAALDKVITFRDKSANPQASGLPQEALEWFWRIELPRLVRRPEVRKQADARIEELIQQQIALEKQIEEVVPGLLSQCDIIQEEIEDIRTAFAVADSEK
jgi:hypothetical protein